MTDFVMVLSSFAENIIFSGDNDKYQFFDCAGVDRIRGGL
jgi:hypothetical protein